VSRPSSWPIGRQRPRPEGPLTGYKIAYPMISADSRRGGFNGVALGRTQVYGTVADAVCIQSPRHRCPSSWCDCGFYCFHALDDARDLACDPQHQHSVLLEIAASGRYVRYELGLRYARQTVRSVRLGRCGCGRAATALADGGPGIVGWRRLHPVCGLCAGPRPVLTPQAFGTLLGGGLRVDVDEVVDDPAAGLFAPLPGAAEGVDDAALVPLLSAEVALLQARLDQVQSRLEHLTRRSD
jgi:hypothetical protein